VKAVVERDVLELEHRLLFTSILEQGWQQLSSLASPSTRSSSFFSPIVTITIQLFHVPDYTVRIMGVIRINMGQLMNNKKHEIKRVRRG
jgi:hypothetical protein